MKKLVTLIFVLTALTSNSCRKVECEDFNLNHEVTNWHLFPNRAETYTFNNDSSALSFNQTDISISEYEEYRCHMCACFRDFNSTYENDSLTFSAYVGYDSTNDLESPAISYTVNGKKIRFYLNSDNSIRLQSSDGEPYNENVEITLRESALVNDRTYNQVLKVDILDENRINRIWVEHGTGLVAIELSGQTITRN